MASRICTHRFERVPSFMPARLPAELTSWHGLPPTITSTGGTVVQSTCVMSPKLGTCGHLYASTLDAAGSLSACHVMTSHGSQPNA